ncbi:MAG: hypothetical protein KDD70_17110 [Bdellovibrionales bacterium]|nr:hypothetical protein [Bdellovibrionales bacterium]
MKSLLFSLSTGLLQLAFAVPSWGCSKIPFNPQTDLPKYDLVIFGEIQEVLPKHYSVTSHFRTTNGRSRTFYSIGKLQVIEELMVSRKIQNLYAPNGIEKVLPLLFIDTENSSPLSNSACPDERVYLGEKAVWLLDRSTSFDGGFFVVRKLDIAALDQIKAELTGGDGLKNAN